MLTLVCNDGEHYEVLAASEDLEVLYNIRDEALENETVSPDATFFVVETVTPKDSVVEVFALES